MKNPFQSTPSVGRATIPELIAVRKDFISIHALRGEGDSCTLITALIRVEISIHALRGEGDEASMCPVSRLKISIHALRGEGDAIAEAVERARDISIHALRGEGDTMSSRPSRKQRQFQSTPSVGRATISRRRHGNWNRDFNPRPPWGGRLRG